MIGRERQDVFKITAMKHLPPLLWGAVIVTASLFQSSFGQILVTYNEDPKSITSQVEGSSVYDFNELKVGETYKDLSWEKTGSFDLVEVVDKAGADGSNYISLGEKGETTLSFAQPHSYFGLWLNPGDGKETITFYANKEVIGVFSSEILISGLAKNPEYSEQSKGAAFVNFYGEKESFFDKITLSNLGGAKFDTDNYTERQEPWGKFKEDEKGPPPGIELTVLGTPTPPVPEPSVALLTVAGIALGLRRRR